LILQASGHGAHNLTPQQARAQARQLQAEANQQHTEVLNQLLVQSAIALAAMALLSIALGWIVAGRVLRPLRTITTAALDISATNLHERLALDGPNDELKELGRHLRRAASPTRTTPPSRSTHDPRAASTFQARFPPTGESPSGTGAEPAPTSSQARRTPAHARNRSPTRL
jgi:HAMP domain-containing protein